MKLKLIPLFAVVVLLSGIISCKKENKNQPAAIGGPLKGADGSLIYSGSADPSSTLGSAGDYYINLATGILYGPKTPTGWGNGVAMTAANAANGGQMLNGNGPPSPTLGNVGDFYLDNSAYLLYGPKTSSGWGLPVSVAAPGSTGIYYSGWAYANNFRDSTIDGSAVKLATLAAPMLTQNYLNTAGIMVYLNYGAGVVPLPYNSYAAGKASVIDFRPQVGLFWITRFTFDDSNTIPLSTSIEYRYVIIPAGQMLAATQNHINLNDYKSVKHYFHLPD